MISPLLAHWRYHSLTHNHIESHKLTGNSASSPCLKISSPGAASPSGMGSEWPVVPYAMTDTCAWVLASSMLPVFTFKVQAPPENDKRFLQSNLIEWSYAVLILHNTNNDRGRIQIKLKNHKTHSFKGKLYGVYRKISNIRGTKSLNLNVSCFSLQMSLRNILKPCVGWRMKT